MAAVRLVRTKASPANAFQWDGDDWNGLRDFAVAHGVTLVVYFGGSRINQDEYAVITPTGSKIVSEEEFNETYEDVGVDDDRPSVSPS